MYYLRGIIGLAVIIAIGFLLSEKKKKIDWRLVGFGLLIQLIFGLLLANVSIVNRFFTWISDQLVILLLFTDEGTRFLFGNLLDNDSIGFVFVLKVLPIIVFFSTLTGGLYYLGVLQFFVKAFARVMRLMKISGPESVSAAGNIFLGQTEAPFLIKPFIATMTRSELMCLMTVGMATISGSSLVAYVVLLGGDDPAEQTKFATFLLSASILNAIAGIIMAKILVPETEFDKLDTTLQLSSDEKGVNLLDALAKGTTSGLRMSLNIGAMLLSFIALIAMLNYLFSGLGSVTGLNEWIAQSSDGVYTALTIEYVLGQFFRPLAFLIGIDWSETIQVGSLIGQKLVVNEFVAYLDLGKLMAADAISERGVLISTYALCGFANFASIAVLIGGIGGLVPSQQENLARLGMKALYASTLANLLTAAIAGMLFGG